MKSLSAQQPSALKSIDAERDFRELLRNCRAGSQANKQDSSEPLTRRLMKLCRVMIAPLNPLPRVCVAMFKQMFRQPEQLACRF
ncbi:MAG: hypothetical protein WCH99_04335 [Verrucomicrobiota bacterium]